VVDTINRIWFTGAMDTFNEVIKTLKKHSRAELQQVADDVGISFHTLVKLANGQTPNPRIRTVEPLLKWHAKRGA